MTRSNARRVRLARAHRSSDLVAKSIKRGLQQAIEWCGDDGAALLQLLMRARERATTTIRPEEHAAFLRALDGEPTADLTGVLAKFAKFSPDFMADGRGDNDQAARAADFGASDGIDLDCSEFRASDELKTLKILDVMLPKSIDELRLWLKTPVVDGLTPEQLEEMHGGRQRWIEQVISEWRRANV